MKVRAKMQNKLASICEDMCKELGAYPLCGGCPNFVAPDSTPGVMTWEELLEHMDNLSAWGHDEIKVWRKQAGALIQANTSQMSCEQQDLRHRATVQNKMAGICEDMCKEVGAYPKCTCPGFTPPDATPGVLTWDELLEHMDNLVDWSADTIKGWHSQAGALVQVESCEKSDTVVRAKMQNKLASICEDMCKELGAYPLCGGCPNFVAPDSTPGVMTWEELLEHMDNLSAWGHDELKAWSARAGALVQMSLKGMSCEKVALHHRAAVQNKLAGICEDMCKEVGAYPKCTCPGFTPPDATPGVLTWDELLEHMDNLVDWSADTIKGWHAQKGALVQVESCEKSDSVMRAKMQNKLASICEDMCKELGAYPLCGGCPNFVAPDSTPGVMTWEELLEHMDNLSAWGHDELKAWTARAGALVQMKGMSCQKQELVHRAAVQNKLAGICEDMCKEVGAYPKCTCPGFTPPDATPGVLTWDELLEHMDNLVDWSADTIKGWHAQKGALVQVQSCEKSETVVRAKMQNKLASICEDMCKELGAYPLCGGCPNFVAPDSTPGVMTWEELLEHMDNLSAWGHDELKAWSARAGALVQEKLEGMSCQKQSLVHRAAVQNRLAGICEDMCKEVGAYPKCTCPGFTPPDATPGVLTWDELLEHMDNLVDWSADSIKGWHSQASQLQVVKAKALRH